MTTKQITTLLYWILFIGIATYLAYAKGWIFANFESLSPQEASALMKSNKNITVLDVRTPEEFAQEHIKGALLIPVQILNSNLSKLSKDKGKKILVYCRSGNRSIAASRILAKNGFIPLNVQGGISQWKIEGLSVVR